MNFPFFIARKIAFRNTSGFSAFIIRIAIAAVALSVAVMIVASSLVNGFQSEIREKVFGFWAHLQVRSYSLSDNYETAGIYKWQDFYNKRKLPGVAHIQTTAYKAGLLKTKTDFEGIVLKGVDADYDWSRFQPYLVEGQSLQQPLQQPGILISRLTASRLQLKLGQKVTVHFLNKENTARPFVITGLYETGIEEFDKEFAITGMEVIQELNHWGKDTVGGFEIFLENKHLFKSRGRAYFLSVFGGLLKPETFQQMNRDPLDEIATQLNYDIGNDRLEVVSLKDLRPGMFDWLDLQTMNELIILALMIAVAMINMITTLLILILDRATMIGLLKAMGADESQLRQLFSWFAFTIIGTGLLIGNTVGLLCCFIQKQFHLIALPQESYYLKYAPIAIQPAWIIGINLATIVLCLIVLQLPVLLIRRISVIRTIRFN